jgi:hypothetical protein
VSGNDLFVVFEVRVFDFPSIRTVLARPEIIGAIPVFFEVIEGVNEFSPTVVN